MKNEAPTFATSEHVSSKEIVTEDHELLNLTIGTIAAEIKSLSASAAHYEAALYYLRKRMLTLTKKRWSLEARLIGVTKVKPILKPKSKSKTKVTELEKVLKDSKGKVSQDLLDHIWEEIRRRKIEASRPDQNALLTNIE